MNTSLWKTKIFKKNRPQPWSIAQPSPLLTRPQHTLPQCTSKFCPITLQEMDNVALFNRVDTKFIMTETQLRSILMNLSQEYRVLTIQNNAINHYRTMYFDTPDFKLFQMHVNKNAERYKVRYREYLDSCQSFLEVKHKTRKDRTIKDRIPATQPYLDITPDAEDWLQEVFPYDTELLEAKIWNTFTRITLVNEACCERVTLDTNLIFYSHDKLVRLDGLAVAEVKADSSRQASPFMEEMQLRRIHPNGFSKYCMGVALLYDHVKKNAMKSKLIMINKMIKGDVVYE